MGYFDIYKKRVNRYGNDYKSRILTQRQEVFSRRLERSVYRTNFLYNDTIYPCTFERRNQDNTNITHYLFTSVDVKIPNGTILFFERENTDTLEDNSDVMYYNTNGDIHIGELSSEDNLQLWGDPIPAQAWMVYWLEETSAKGYNRYVMLKMTHKISWIGRDKQTYSTYVYMYGQEDNMLKNEILSRSRMDSVYSENLKLSFLVCPTNKNLNRDDYFEVIINEIIQPFRVTGYDILSTPGVEFVTIDPIYEFDKAPAPEKQETDNDEDFYWLEGV